METTITLLEYLKIPVEEKNETELYGNFPLNLEQLYEQFAAEQEALYRFDEKTMAREIKDAVYLAEGDETTIELHSLSVLLRVKENFPLKLAKEFCDKYSGNFQFIALKKLLSEQTNLIDPGEYLTLTFPETSLATLLADSLLLQVCTEFASLVERQMEKKIKQTGERLTELRRLGAGETLELDYLDVRNSSPNFVSFDQPQNSPRTATFHYFNRQLGQINTLYTGERRNGILTMTRKPLDPEDREILQQKLEHGSEIFYLRDWEKVLLKEYLESETRAV